jgi:hypothetical protein
MVAIPGPGNGWPLLAVAPLVAAVVAGVLAAYIKKKAFCEKILLILSNILENLFFKHKFC